MNMRIILGLAALVTFMAVGIFGFTSMSHGHNGCLAEAVQGKTCPENKLALVNFHLDAYKSFSLVLLSAGAAALLALAALALFFFTRFHKYQALLHRVPLRFGAAPTWVAGPPRNAPRISRWLKLHENSPCPR